MSQFPPVPVIDLMMGLPHADRAQWMGAFPSGVFRDEDSGSLRHGAGYMFRDLPEVGPEDFEQVVLAEMDRHGIDLGLMPVTFDESCRGRHLVERHPDRFVGSFVVDPNMGMDAVRLLQRAVEELGVVAANAFPAGCFPQVPIDDRRFYPLYAKCIELDIPVCINAGVPGPRVPMDCQRVDRLDEVCYFFPELRIVMRHGAEPWTDLAVKLMLKWPNLYYSTSAFAPRYYPKAIIDFANSRGADKVMYAGYFPSGLSLERIFREMPDVPLRPEVWPKFLRQNAVRVFKLDRLVSA